MHNNLNRLVALVVTMPQMLSQTIEDTCQYTRDSNSIATSKRFRHYHQANDGAHANLKVVMVG